MMTELSFLELEVLVISWGDLWVGRNPDILTVRHGL